MAPDRFRHRVVAPAPLDRVWQALQEPETWGNIGGVDEVFDPVFGPDGTLQGYRFVATAAGRAYEGRARTVETVPPRQMVVAVSTPEVDGTIDVGLEPVDADTTAVDVTLTLKANGILAMMFLPVIASAVGSGLPRHLEEFAEHVARG